MLDEVPQFVPTGGSRESHMVHVGFEIKVRIVDPVGLIDTKRNFYQAAAKYPGSIQARLDQLVVAAKVESAAWGATENDATDVHRSTWCFQIYERRIYAGKLLHRTESIPQNRAHRSRYIAELHRPDPKIHAMLSLPGISQLLMQARQSRITAGQNQV